MILTLRNSPGPLHYFPRRPLLISGRCRRVRMPQALDMFAPRLFLYQIAFQAVVM